MNLPNKLTISRIILTPIFLVLLFMSFDGHWLAACAVFSLASLTDTLDGTIARKQGIVSTFGKFLDPLADKILVSSAFIAFAALGLAHPIVAIIVVVRDYVISAIRLLAVSSEGKVIAANNWGKIKTLSSMIVMIIVMCAMHFAEKSGADALAFVARCSNWAMWALAAITALSGIIYVVQNKELLKELK